MLVASVLLSMTIAGTWASNSVPINNMKATACFDEKKIKFIADANSICHFHQCVTPQSLVVRECGLGTYVPDDYTAGAANPCSMKFDPKERFNCTRGEGRSAKQQPPECYTTQFQSSCRNGGTALWEGDACWCRCPPDFSGSPDCASRTRSPPPSTPTDGPCIDGRPKAPWCRLAAEGGGSCRNGGTCIDQCDGYICQCPPSFRNSRNCD